MAKWLFTLVGFALIALGARESFACDNPPCSPKPAFAPPPIVQPL